MRKTEAAISMRTCRSRTSAASQGAFVDISYIRTKVRITKSEISMRTWRSPMSATLQGAFVVIPEISLCDISDIIKYCSNTNVNHRWLIYASILTTVYLIYDESAAIALVTLVYKCIPCLSHFNIFITRTKNFIGTCLHRSHCPICKSKCFYPIP